MVLADADDVPFPSPWLLPPHEADDVHSLPHPRVTPPVTARAEIFRRHEMAAVDKHVLSTPGKTMYMSLVAVVDYLLKDSKGWTDMQRLWALFKWVTSNPQCFAGVDPKDITDESAISFLSMAFCDMLDFSLILEALCHIARIPCYAVKGYQKLGVDQAYDSGKGLDWNLLKKWNVVYIEDSWRLLDPRLSAGRLKETVPFVDTETENEPPEEQPDDFFFLPNPEHLKWLCYPVENPKLQLCEQEVTKEEFESHYLVRENFFILGIKEIEDTVMTYLNDIEDGSFKVCFGLPCPESRTMRFTHNLVRHEKGKRRYVDDMLNSYVLREQTDNMIQLSARVPIGGRFSLELRGNFERHLKKSNSDDLCCRYVINTSSKPKPCLPLPIDPAIGWGPVPGLTDHWLEPVLHKRAEIETKSSFEKIRLMKKRSQAVYQFLQHCTLGPDLLCNYSVTDIDKDELMVYIRLPMKGEYALEFLSQQPEEEGSANNILNYLINTQAQDKEAHPPFPNLTTGTLGQNQHVRSDLSVQALSHTDGMVKSPDGQLTLKFHSVRPLRVELHSVDGHALRNIRHDLTNEGSKWKLELELPVKGEYALNVFSLETEDSVQLHHMYSYLVNSDGQDVSEMLSQKHQEVLTVPTEVVHTEDRQLSIPLPTMSQTGYASLHRRDGQDSQSSNTVTLRVEDQQAWVDIAVGSDGEYMLTLYITKDEQLAEAVKKYIINKGSTTEFDVEKLSKDIGFKIPAMPKPKLEKPPPPPPPPPKVEKKPEKAPKPPKEKDKALEDLQAKNAELRASMFRHQINDLSSETLREIRGYVKPPYGVYESVKATCLLLGYKESELETWLNIQGKLTQSTVVTQSTYFLPNQVSLKTAKKVDKILQPLDLGAIHDASSGAASFYVWAIEAVESVLKFYGASKATSKGPRPPTADAAREPSARVKNRPKSSHVKK